MRNKVWKWGNINSRDGRIIFVAHGEILNNSAVVRESNFLSLIDRLSPRQSFSNNLPVMVTWARSYVMLNLQVLNKHET